MRERLPLPLPEPDAVAVATTCRFLPCCDWNSDRILGKMEDVLRSFQVRDLIDDEALEGILTRALTE